MMNAIEIYVTKKISFLLLFQLNKSLERDDYKNVKISVYAKLTAVLRWVRNGCHFRTFGYRFTMINLSTARTSNFEVYLFSEFLF